MAEKIFTTDVSRYYEMRKAESNLSEEIITGLFFLAVGGLLVYFFSQNHADWIKGIGAGFWLGMGYVKLIYAYFSFRKMRYYKKFLENDTKSHV